MQELHAGRYFIDQIFAFIIRRYGRFVYVFLTMKIYVNLHDLTEGFFPSP